MDAIRWGYLPGGQDLPETGINKVELESTSNGLDQPKAGGQKRVPSVAHSPHKENALGIDSVQHAEPNGSKTVHVLLFSQECFHERPKLIADHELPALGSKTLGSWPRARLRLRVLYLLTCHDGRLSRICSKCLRRRLRRGQLQRISGWIV